MRLELAQKIRRLVIVYTYAGIRKREKQLLILKVNMVPLFTLSNQLIEVLRHDIHGFNVWDLKPFVNCLSGEVHFQNL